MKIYFFLILIRRPPIFAMIFFANAGPTITTSSSKLSGILSY